MDLTTRNKKVAINRWKRTLENESKNIRKDKTSMILRSEICGFLAGDGSVQIRKEKSFYHYQLDFFPDDDIMLQRYLKIISLVYNKEPQVLQKHNYYTVRLTSKTIIVDLLKYATFGVQKWNIPIKLLEYHNADKKWLKAFFSAEGTVDNKRIKIQSINEIGMEQVSQLLNNNNIEHKRYKYKPKNVNYNEVHIIMIFKKEARRIFQKKVGFYHSKKELTLKKSLDL